MAIASLLAAGAAGGCALDASKDASPSEAERRVIAVTDAAPPPTADASGKPRALFADEATEEEETTGLTEPIVERGEGSVIGSPRLSARADIRTDDAGDITLNVVDAEIRDVVRLVLEDALGVNYTIDPAVTGSITVRTSRPISADDVIATLGSILSVNGAALVEADGLYKVVPIESAVTAGYRPLGRSAGRLRGAASGVYVAPLYHADAVQLAELLQPFVGNQGSVQVDAARNTLLLAGSPDQIATMNDLIDMFDVDWMRGMSFGIYPLNEVGASQLAEEIDQILGDPEAGVLEGGVRLVPIDRLSALIVIATHPDGLERVASWIERLDREGQGEGEQLYVYEVQNSRASDLASVLGELFDIRSVSFGEESLLAPGLEPIELGSSLPGLESPDETGVDDERGAAARESRSRDRPRRGDSAGRFSRQALTEGQTGSETRIVADETNNALLIRSTPEEYDEIEAAIRELDKEPLQVLLEATIAEVSLNDELSYGVQWFFGSGDSGVTLSEFGDGSVAQIFPGFSGLLSRGDVRVVLNALETVSEVNVVSSPQILVLDNQTAQLEVGDEVPIVTQTAEGIETSDARILNTVEQRQTGVILNVTPRVNANGQVVLDIEQEVSDVVQTTTSGIDSPTIAQRRISTSVAVSSDQTVVLGGLIQEDVDDINSGVPFLKDLPGIGFLFGATTKLTSRTELLVLITPKVLVNQNDAIVATEELRRRFGSLEPLQARVRPEQARPGPSDRAEAEEGFFVQLATAPTQSYAWSLWSRLQSEHEDDLTGLQPQVVPATEGDDNAYSLRVGPFDQAGKTAELCALVGGDEPGCERIEAD